LRRSGTGTEQVQSRRSFISRADRARDGREWEVAAELYRKALDRNPNDTAIWVQYGHALKESGNLAEAESAYRGAIARDAGTAEPHLQLGHLLKMCGRREEAQTAYLQALALQPSMTEPLHGLDSLGWHEQQLTELTRFFTPDLFRPEPRLPSRAGLAKAQTTRHNIDAWGSSRAPDKSPVGQLADALKRWCCQRVTVNFVCYMFLGRLILLATNIE
jgi:tetratricopeptide (TPR) repeat protein